jgi:hypothetical protein
MGPVILLGDEKSNFAVAQFYRFASTKVAIINTFLHLLARQNNRKGLISGWRSAF